MAGLELAERRHLEPRLFHLEATAGLEGTRLRRPQHVPRRAFDRLQLRLPLGVEPGDALQEPQRVRVARPAEELIGAAHAACYSMAVSNELSKAGFVPNRVDVIVEIDADRAEKGWTVQRSRIILRADVPNVDEETFQRPVGRGQEHTQRNAVPRAPVLLGSPAVEEVSRHVRHRSEGLGNASAALCGPHRESASRAFSRVRKLPRLDRVKARAPM